MIIYLAKVLLDKVHSVFFILLSGNLSQACKFLSGSSYIMWPWGFNLGELESSWALPEASSGHQSLAHLQWLLRVTAPLRPLQAGKWLRRPLGCCPFSKCVHCFSVSGGIQSRDLKLQSGLQETAGHLGKARGKKHLIVVAEELGTTWFYWWAAGLRVLRPEAQN